jgi:hypothetical protein
MGVGGSGVGVGSHPPFDPELLLPELLLLELLLEVSQPV